MKTNKIIYWIITGLFSAMTLAGAAYYIFAYDKVASMFNSLGYSEAIIYPLAIAKILGIIAITTDKSKVLKLLAYAGFVIDLVLAIAAHISVQDGEQGGAIMALVLLLGSFFFDRKIKSA